MPPRKEVPAHGLRVGPAVFHTKSGEGKVLALEELATTPVPRSTFRAMAPQVAGAGGIVDHRGITQPAVGRARLCAWHRAACVPCCCHAGVTSDF